MLVAPADMFSKVVSGYELKKRSLTVRLMTGFSWQRMRSRSQMVQRPGPTTGETTKLLVNLTMALR